MIVYEEILKEFQKQKVKYVIVGGIAVTEASLNNGYTGSPRFETHARRDDEP